MGKRLLAFVLCIVLICACMPTALADDSNDVTAPHLLGVTINTTGFTNKDPQGNHTLDVVVTTDEAESGLLLGNTLNCCWLEFLDTSQTDPNLCVDAVCIQFSEETSPGTLHASVDLSHKVGGTYTLYSVNLSDKDGNTSAYYANYQDAPGATGPVPTVSFTLDSDYQIPIPPPDPADTALKSFRLSKSSANVGDKITYTIAANDPSIHSMTMSVTPMGMPWYYQNLYYNVPLSPVSGQPGVFTGKLSVTADMPQGDYYPYDLVLTSGTGTQISVDCPANYNSYLGNVVLRVANPARLPADIVPTLTSFSMSGHQAVPGQAVTVTATLDSKSPAFDHMAVSLFNTDSGTFVPGFIKLSSQGAQTYSGVLQLPLDLRHGHYVLCSPMVFKAKQVGGGIVTIDPTLRAAAKDCDGDDVTYIKGSEIQVTPAITISAADNQTILKGTPFDAAQGVTARNEFSGNDITGKIAVTGGNIDTNVPGIYLAKYVVSDTITLNGQDNTVSYTAYRWIGVTDLLPDAATDSGAPLAITAGDMAIGANGGDVSLQKDGKAIPFSGVVHDPGVYTLTSGGSPAAQGVSPAAGQRSAQLSSAIGASNAGNRVTAVIDRAGPDVKASWAKGASGISVALKGYDACGVAELKYLLGAHSLDECRSAGTAYAGVFKIPGLGAVTVYSRDKLGNESLKVVNINSSCSDSAYLEGIALSAGTLSRAFSSKVYSYKVGLRESQGTVTITPAALFEGSRILINGKAVPSATIAVANAKSVTVTVKVLYGKQSHTYTLLLTRAKSTRNDLASIAASAGTFSAPFNPSVTSYVLTLPEGTAKVKLKAIGTSALETIIPASRAYTLSNGQTVKASFKVKAQSGAVKTYTVTITRAKSTNANLLWLKAAPGKYSLTPAFRAEQTDYKMMLPANKSSVILACKAADKLSSVKIDGAKRTSKTIKLAGGQSATVTVTVTAQAGNIKTYTIIVSAAK